MSSKTQKMPTFFAPAERAEKDEFDELVGRIIQEPIVHTVLKTVDGFMVILNPERQILCANSQVLDTLGLDLADCLGKRPGELLDCVHHKEGPGGCGTSRHCANCGAVLAILSSQELKEPVEAECLLTRTKNGVLEAAEFRVRSTPLNIAGKEVLAFVLNDISPVKRKEALEQVFFHDLMNILSGLKGYLQLWEMGAGMDLDNIAPTISNIVQRLVSEVEAHRTIVQAENNDLFTQPVKTTPDQVMAELAAFFQGHEAGKDRKLNFTLGIDESRLWVDQTLLLRILVNMVKNALEATPPHGEVNIWFENREEGPTFLVKNDQFIPEKVSLQVFQRSFSTKGGRGRGLGTYGMKLIGEKYLKGEVGFKTDAQEGTTFHIILPAIPYSQGGPKR